MNIYDIKTLTQFFIHQNGGEIYEELKGNSGQVGTIIQIGKQLYYIFYKKEWFITFARFFPKFKGVGMGTSWKFLQRAADENAIIVFYVKDKEYQIYAKTMKDFVEKHKTLKYFEADQDMIANISASYLEKNLISKKKIEEFMK